MRVGCVFCLFVLASACNALPHPADDVPEASELVDVGALDDVAGDLDDARVPPRPPQQLLDAPVWPTDEVARRVAACHAWHARQARHAELPEPDRVLDCAHGCALDVEVEIVPKIAIDVVITWREGESVDRAMLRASSPSLVLHRASTTYPRTIPLLARCGDALCASAFVEAGDITRVTLDMRMQAVDPIPWGQLVLYEGAPLEVDTVVERELTLDDAVRLHGSASFEGSTPGPDARWRLDATLTGSSSTPWSERTWRFETPDYEVSLWPGRWDLVASPTQTEQVIVADALELTADTRLDIDARRVRLSGQLFGFQVTAAAPFRAWFEPVDRQSFNVPLEVVDGRYAVDVFPGIYTVTVCVQSACAGARDVVLDDDTVLDLTYIPDEPGPEPQPEPEPEPEPEPSTTRVDGTIWLDGAPLRELTTEERGRRVTRPHVEARRLGQSRGPSVELDDATFSLELEPGTWVLELDWRHPQTFSVPLAGGHHRLQHRLTLEHGSLPISLHLSLPPSVPLVGDVDTTADVRRVAFDVPWGATHHEVELDELTDDKQLVRRFELDTRVLAGVYDVHLARTYGGPLTVRACHPLLGHERLDLAGDLLGRPVTLRATDARTDTPLPATFDIRQLATAEGYPVQTEGQTISTPPGADHELTVRLPPGRYEIEVEAHDESHTEIVEVR